MRSKITEKGEIGVDNKSPLLNISKYSVPLRILETAASDPLG